MKVRLLNNGAQIDLPGPLSKYDSVTHPALEEICDNLVNLESFNEGIILHHVKKRYFAQVIYTFVGNILIAVNPYKALDIYGLPLMESTLDLTRRNEVVPAHVYSIGAVALNNMRNDSKDQSILISGAHFGHLQFLTESTYSRHHRRKWCWKN